MIYLKEFTLLNEDNEHSLVFDIEKRRIFNSYYPVGIFSIKNFELQFS